MHLEIANEYLEHIDADLDTRLRLKECIDQVCDSPRLKMLRECEIVFKAKPKPKYKEKINLAINTRLLELEELKKFENSVKDFIK